MDKSTHTPQYDALRSKLRAVREMAGLTQRQIAATLNVPRSWVAKVEGGERRIDLVEFAWFVEACGSEPVAIARELFAIFGAASRSNRQGGNRSK